MKKATVTMVLVMGTEDELFDSETYETYFRQAAESALRDIPEDWWHADRGDSLYIETAEISHVQVHS